jgi:hypothetical protein
MNWFTKNNKYVQVFIVKIMPHRFNGEIYLQEFIHDWRYEV